MTRLTEGINCPCPWPPSPPTHTHTQGLGQVNGADPAIWEIVSTNIINCFQDSGHGAVFKCYISHNSLKILRYCFVEDSTIIQTAPSPTTTTTETVRPYQSDLDLFSWAVQKTGGQVSVRKTKWYLLELKWDSNSQWRLSDNQSDLFLNTPEGPQKREGLPASQDSRILGVWISPAGSSNEQKKQLMTITTAWYDRVRSGHIIKADAWYYYQSTVKKSLEYPLVATTMLQ